MNSNERVAIALFMVGFLAVAIFATSALENDAQSAAVAGITGIVGAIAGATIAILGSFVIEDRRAGRERGLAYVSHLFKTLDQLEVALREIDTSVTKLDIAFPDIDTDRAIRLEDARDAAFHDALRLVVNLPSRRGQDLVFALLDCQMEPGPDSEDELGVAPLDRNCNDAQISTYEWIGEFRVSLLLGELPDD